MKEIRINTPHFTLKNKVEENNAVIVYLILRTLFINSDPAISGNDEAAEIYNKVSLDNYLVSNTEFKEFISNLYFGKYFNEKNIDITVSPYKSFFGTIQSLLLMKNYIFRRNNNAKHYFIYFPDITISNTAGLTEYLGDIVVAFYWYSPRTIYLSRIFPGQTINLHAHPHVSQGGSFCLGPYFGKDKLQRVVNFRGFLEWESQEGVPYETISDLYKTIPAQGSIGGKIRVAGYKYLHEFLKSPQNITTMSLLRDKAIKQVSKEYQETAVVKASLPIEISKVTYYNNESTEISKNFTLHPPELVEMERKDTNVTIDLHDFSQSLLNYYDIEKNNYEDILYQQEIYIGEY